MTDNHDILSSIYKKIESSKKNGEKYISLNEFGFIGYKRPFYICAETRRFVPGNPNNIRLSEPHQKIINELKKEYEIYFSAENPVTPEFYEDRFSFGSAFSLFIEENGFFKPMYSPFKVLVWF